MVTAALGLAAYGSALESTNTLCPESGPKSTTPVILDGSDPLAPHQLEALDQFKNSFVEPDSENFVSRGHLLVVYELPRTGVVPVEKFRSCSPGHPDECNVFTEGSIACRLRWSEYLERLQGAFSTASGGASAPSSPIIETIRHVRNKEFPRPPDMDQSTRHRLWIVSDMLQNSGLVSHYDRPFPDVQGLPERLAVDLKGFDICVRYLHSTRDAHLQTGEHFAWWRSFFSEGNAPMSCRPDTW